jgi:hypothetical protein
LAFDTGADTVLIGPPLGKLREIVKNPLGVGVENVGTVLMDEQSFFIMVIIGIATDMRALLDKQNLLIPLTGQALR